MGLHLHLSYFVVLPTHIYIHIYIHIYMYACIILLSCFFSFEAVGFQSDLSQEEEEEEGDGKKKRKNQTLLSLQAKLLLTREAQKLEPRQQCQGQACTRSSCLGRKLRLLLALPLGSCL